MVVGRVGKNLEGVVGSFRESSIFSLPRHGLQCLPVPDKGFGLRPTLVRWRSFRSNIQVQITRPLRAEIDLVLR